jgi:hypothetical protein
MNKTQIRDLIKKAANRKKGIGAIPVGLKFTIAGVKMYVEAQYDIYNKVHINIIEQGSLKTVVKIDGVAKNKKDQIEKLYKFVVNNSKEVTEKITSLNYQKGDETRDTGYKLADESKLIPVRKIVDQLSSEVSTANNPRKVVTKRSPVKRREVNISPSRAGFVFRRLGDDIIEVPKNTTTFVKIDKLPQYEFFAIKDNNTWLILETTSGMSLGADARTKREAVELANIRVNESIAKDRDYLPNIIKKYILPNEYLNRLKQNKTPGKTMTRPAAVKVKTATKTARKVIANRAAKSRPAAVKVKTASKTARKATATRTATKKAKSKPTGETGVLKYSKRLGNGKYEYKYVKKR